MSGAVDAACEGPWRLRDLRPRDQREVEALEAEIFGPEAWTAPMVREELESGFRRYLAAVEPAGAIVGYGGIALGEAADLMTLGVRTPWRGRGIGRRLLLALLAEARAAGSTEAFLEVRRSNRAARALYGSAGFLVIGRIRGYFHAPREDALSMRAPL